MTHSLISANENEIKIKLKSKYSMCKLKTQLPKTKIRHLCLIKHFSFCKKKIFKKEESLFKSTSVIPVI